MQVKRIMDNYTLYKTKMAHSALSCNSLLKSNKVWRICLPWEAKHKTASPEAKAGLHTKYLIKRREKRERERQREFFFLPKYFHLGFPHWGGFVLFQQHLAMLSSLLPQNSWLQGILSVLVSSVAGVTALFCIAQLWDLFCVEALFFGAAVLQYLHFGTDNMMSQNNPWSQARTQKVQARGSLEPRTSKMNLGKQISYLKTNK